MAGVIRGEGEQMVNCVAVKIDLTEDGIRFTGTPPNGAEPEETAGQVASAFLKEHQVQVAVNTSFFAPCCDFVPGQPKDLASLAVLDGEIISPWGKDKPVVLMVDRENHAQVIRQAPDSVANLQIAVSGTDLLDGGQVVESQPNEDLHPRTAAGLTQDGRYLIFLIIDGRQPGHSAGASLRMTARWLQYFGAHEGLNLDGGGSSVLAVADPDTASGFRLLNRPSSVLQRVNGNHLGIFAHALSEN